MRRGKRRDREREEGDVEPDDKYWRDLAEATKLRRPIVSYLVIGFYLSTTIQPNEMLFFTTEFFPKSYRHCLTIEFVASFFWEQVYLA